MRIGVILFLLLFIPIVNAQEEYQNYKSITLNTKIFSSITLEPGINYLSSDLYFSPKETESQDITEKKYSDKVIEKQNYVTYEWNNPEDKINFYLDYNLKSRFNLVEIKNKILYPINVPSEYEEYLKSTDLINSNHMLIRNQVDEILNGEDDTYEIIAGLSLTEPE